MQAFKQEKVVQKALAGVKEDALRRMVCLAVKMLAEEDLHEEQVRWLADFYKNTWLNAKKKRLRG